MSSPADPPPRPLQAAELLAALNERFPIPQCYRVAFSGGLDSTVLLHLLASLRPRLRAPLAAIHVDHGLQAVSADWSVHCAAACAKLGVPLTRLVVDAAPAPGESPEAAAREARYAAIAGALGDDEMLLTAHHLDDQAETVLLQLLRGAGVDGLAAMPVLRRWQRGWHLRPLLAASRKQIRAWAGARGLDWVEDPSNRSTAADRNFIRRRVLPVLDERWPGAAASLAHSAAHCAEASGMLRAQAADDLGRILSADGRRLRVDGLCALPAARAHQVLRLWLRRRGVPPLPRGRLQEARRQLCEAASDAQPQVRWSGRQLRRYRGEVWLLAEPPAVRIPSAPLAWAGEVIELGPGLGRLRRVSGEGGIDPQLWQQGRVEVGFNHGDVDCRLRGRDGRRNFKRLAQELAIPPWTRPRVPLVLIDGRVAAVADLCVCEPFAVAAGETGWSMIWERDDETA